MKQNISTPEGRKSYLRGLVSALEQIAAEEQIKAVQLKLFQTLESKDVKKIQ